MHIFLMVVALPGNTPIAPELRSHINMSCFCLARTRRFPNRLLTVICCLSNEGEYDMVAGSCFTFRFADEDQQSKAVTIKHIDGSEPLKIPDHITITRAFKLSQWHDDLAASVTLKPVTVVLASFYEDGQGPKAVQPEKKKLSEHISELLSSPRASKHPAEFDTPDRQECFSQALCCKRRMTQERATKALGDYREKRRRAEEVDLTA